MEIVKKEQANGGEGAIFIKHILNETELNGKCKMFAEVTIPAGCSLGYHVHHNESETYYIVKGEGEYNDNGTTRTVKAGERTFTPGWLRPWDRQPHRPGSGIYGSYYPGLENQETNQEAE